MSLSDPGVKHEPSVNFSDDSGAHSLNENVPAQAEKFGENSAHGDDSPPASDGKLREKDPKGRSENEKKKANGDKPLVRSETTMSAVDERILEMQTSQVGKHCFITKLDSRGNIQQVPVCEDDADSNANMSVSDIIAPDMLGRPFASILGTSSGMGMEKLNPFRKKSGILNVIRAQAKRNRVVSKHGNINTFNRPEEGLEQHRYLKDLFTTTIDLNWSWTLLNFATAFFTSWLLFAVVWYLVALAHGDLKEGVDENDKCVAYVNSFTTCFLFSLETQHTIGYGGRATTENCPVAIIVMSLQSIVGVVIQACMAGIVFAKFTKPTNRAETILFSKNALITLRNGCLYLVCRIGDLRARHLLESHVSGHMIHKCTTDENEVIPYHMEQMEFGSELDGSNDFVQLFWPICISHKIDEDSPLWEMSPRDVLASTFEIIVTMEGTTPETGNSIQVRTSYLPNEILWGYRFDHTSVAYDKQAAKYAVSYTTINKCTADRTPRCSAKEWEERKMRRTSSSLNDIAG